MSARSPREIVDGHEASLDADHRRRQGVHYTPEQLAGRIVELGWAALGRVPERVCDPSCGAGSVLLAAADRFVAAGVDPAEVVQCRLVGVEIDAAAVAAARAALVRWARGHGVGDARPVVLQRDALDGAVPVPDGPRVDLVCGNPPFLGQLRRRTVLDAQRRSLLSQRWPELGAYTDAAGLHLLAALDLVDPSGVVALLQPRSVLGSRDAAAVRQAVVRRGRLVTLWSAPGPQFADTSVGVCLPVVRLGHAPGRVGPGATELVELVQGDDPAHAVPAPTPAWAWSALLARLEGAPPVTPSVPTLALGDLVQATAGFRDEFYALTGAAVEGPEGGHPLVSVGMIDPAELRWGERPRRIGGRRMSAPVVPTPLLGPGASGPAAWARRRLVPKVLVATQTKVLEVVLDRRGDLVPLTPVISVEPSIASTVPGGAALLEAVAAALSAPCTSALLTYRVAGTGLAREVLRPSARVLEALPFPVAADGRRDLALAWQVLEQQCSRGPAPRDAWVEFARRCDAAFGIADDALIDWWWSRHPAARRGTPARVTGGPSGRA